MMGVFDGKRSARPRGTPLKILIYGLNFSPELTGIGRYTGEMARWLAARGHQVDVVTAPPYYPAWRLAEGFRNWYQREQPLPNLVVRRCPLYIPATQSGLHRVLHLSSFAVSSLCPMILAAARQPDVVFAVEPTFFAAPVALLAAPLAGAPTWLHVQDFEVDAAFDLGLLPAGGLLQRMALCLERWFTRQFDRVSSISARMVERAIAKGVPPSRVTLFPNWVDPSAIVPACPSERNHLREQLGLEGKLVLLYSGNLGEKQGLDCLPPLAKALVGHSRAQFVFCGDGAFRPELEALVAGLPNVTLLPLQPPERLNDLLNLAAIHLLPQKAGVADLVMPSKLTGMMASGRPVLAMALPGSQVAQVVSGRSDTGDLLHLPCGLVTPPDDLEALIQAAHTLLEDEALRRSLGRGARAYAIEHLGETQVLQQIERQLAELIEQRRSSFQ